MKLKIYQVDVFANTVFKGNPAAVCPLTEWLADDILIKIARENNLLETAFYVVTEDRIEIWWFTPKMEIHLCGHATLATAFQLSDRGGEIFCRNLDARVELAGTVVPFMKGEIIYLIKQRADKLYLDISLKK